MLSVGYDQSDYFEHRIEHRNILNDIFSMDPDKFESSDEMKLFIKRIVDNHIEQFDSKLFKFCEHHLKNFWPTLNMMNRLWYFLLRSLLISIHHVSSG